MRSAEPHTLTKQILIINLDRERFGFLHAAPAPSANLFFTRSPQKARLWSQLEPLDLIIMRFGEPFEPALDLLQSLIEANPAPPVLLLAEPGAERVADRLVHRGICLMQPAAIAPESLQSLIQQLLNFHSPGARPPAHREPAIRPAAASASGGSRAHPPSQAASPELAPLTVSPDWEFPFLDQLVIELAHRLKNPLVSIKTFTHLLRERFSDPEFRERFYAIVGNDVIQLNEVVDRLLEFTEFARPYPKPLRLDEELKQAVDAVESALQAKQLTVDLDIRERSDAEAKPSLQLCADPMQFRYLLKQLLLDSAVTAPAGEQLRLTVGVGQADEPEPAFSLCLETAAGPDVSGRPHEWPSLELLLAKNLIERQHGTMTVSTTPAPGGGRRRVTVAIPLTTMAQPHEGLLDGSSASRVPVDRRRIPLAIAFRERRHAARRQQSLAIPFTDRRGPSGDPQ